MIGGDDIRKDLNLLFDVLVGEEESGACACTQNSLISFKIVSPKITCHPSSPEKVFQVLQEVGGVVSPAKSIY